MKFKNTAQALAAVTLLGASSSPSSHAQVLDTSGGAGAGTPSFPSPNQNNGGGGGNDAKNQSATVFGNEVPTYNPEEDTVSYGGGTFQVMDNRLLEARFEKYLALPAADSEQDQAYRTVLDDILDHLSPHQKGGPNFPRSVALLPLASEFSIDARLCDSLANAIYGAVQSSQNVAGMHKTLSDIKKERRAIAWNAEMASKNDNFKSVKQKVESPEEILAKWGRMSLYAKDLVELEGQSAEVKVEMISAKALGKVQFQALIIQFFVQRRYEHVIIACRMYRQLFKEGDSSLEIEKGSEVDKLFSSSLGVSPTINTLDAAANEIIRDVDEGVDSFLLLAERGDIESASKRLAEAFVPGEYLPKVRTVPLEQKQKVVKFVRSANHLKAALQVRDFKTAEDLVNEMKDLAGDFEYAKPLGMINAAKTVSSLHLDKARVAAVNGDAEVFGEEMRKATEIWPTNPRLTELSGMVTKAGDRQSQAKLDFDRLVAQKNYREIFNAQGRFSAAVGDDPQRREQLEDIIKEMLEVTTRIEIVKGQAQSGYHFDAWETLRTTARKYPNDTTVANELTRATVEVPSFVKAVQTAEDLEDRGQLGSSLAMYLKARQLHPGSRFAREGIARVLDSLEPGGTSPRRSAPRTESDLPKVERGVFIE